MTEKLYYTDAYIKEFTACVLSCEAEGDHFVTVLDRTAFFPEEGGQSADTGNIGAARVSGACEIDGVIRHYTDLYLEVGSVVTCAIDFDARFDKMQCHTGEHIVSGIIHSLCGFDNVGFHLGADEVTIDVNGVMDREMLDRVEELANRAIYENIPVVAVYPTTEEIPNLSYRAKLDITENLRIVNIEGYDSCACCAPHVAYTGEIGIIKLLDFEKHRGGVRIRMLAGARALRDYREKYRNLQSISAALCVPQHSTAQGLEQYMSGVANTEWQLREALLTLARLYAESVTETDGNLVRYLKGLGINEAREFVNSVMDRVGGVTVALVGEEGDYKYVIAASGDIKAILGAANAALSGKGGGKPPMAQGSFKATLKEIEEYFA